MTHEEFVSRVANARPHVKIESQYISSREPVTYSCKECGTRFVAARANRLYDAHGCLVCEARKRARRKTNEEFVDELKVVNPSIIPLEDYISTSVKIKFRCSAGHIWDAAPKSLLDGHGCPECSHQKQNWKTHDDFVKEIHKKHPSLIVTGTFSGVGKKVDMTCSACGYQWSPFASAILKSPLGCPRCNHQTNITEKELIERLEKVNPKIKYCSGFINSSSKAMFECQVCHIRWEALVGNILSGKGCPRCKESAGEKRISRCLLKRHIQFEPQYRFPDCKDARPLPFDFYLPAYNTCIEYDGIQHYDSDEYASLTRSSDNTGYMLLQKHDRIKTDYCQTHGIELLRIPYTEINNIENIINELIP